MPQETENNLNPTDGLTVEQIFIPDSELIFVTSRASGPGGQYVNRTESAVQLRFDATHSPSLPEDVRQRLLKAVSSRLTADGILLIDVQEERSQLHNKELALEKLSALIAKALYPPKKRIRTKPTAASKERRLQQKKRDSEIKRNRQKPID
ncbi:MAG: aminoacyl-tRNA hydrolase [Victivallales bacterium]|nr:aminoacyl-tRNA hydrolase [Victivallales bacterium]